MSGKETENHAAGNETDPVNAHYKVRVYFYSQFLVMGCGNKMVRFGRKLQFKLKTLLFSFDER